MHAQCRASTNVQMGNVLSASATSHGQGRFRDMDALMSRRKPKSLRIRTLIEVIAFVAGFTLPIIWLAILMCLFSIAGCIGTEDLEGRERLKPPQANMLISR